MVIRSLFHPKAHSFSRTYLERFLASLLLVLLAIGTIITSIIPSDAEADDIRRFGLSISDDTEVIIPGKTLRYVAVVRNAGRSLETEDIRISLPTSVEVLSVSPEGFRERTHTILWRQQTLAPQEKKFFSILVRTDARTTDDVHLKATLFTSTGHASDTTVVRLTGEERDVVSVRISDGVTVAKSDEHLTYVIQAGNSGNSPAVLANVSAALPLYSEFVASSHGGIWDSSNVRWKSIDIAPHSVRELSFTIRVRPDAPNDAVLLASVQGDDHIAYDRTSIGESFTEDTFIPDVRIRRTVNAFNPVPGGSVRFSLFIKNSTNSTLRSVRVTESFDPSKFDVYKKASIAGKVNDNGTIEWVIPVLKPNETQRITYTLNLAKSVRFGEKITTIARVDGIDRYAAISSYKFTVSAPTKFVLPVTGTETGEWYLSFFAIIAAGISTFSLRKSREI